MKHIPKIFLVIIGVVFSTLCFAVDGRDLWLAKNTAVEVKVVLEKHSAMLDLAKSELMAGWQGKKGQTMRLLVKENPALVKDGFLLSNSSITSNTELGVLYGVFDLLRRQQTGEAVEAVLSNPSYQYRLLNHWDNQNGSIERGYAGKSIFWRPGSDQFKVTDADKVLWQNYARANASIGINGAVLNNVNANPSILNADYLKRAAAIADELRPYGVRVFLSINFASPARLGGLKTSDPLDKEVIAWWKSKVQEIYRQIPDFGGFLVKASSEGQPGPQDFGRTHADGANMLADELKPFGGIVMWRAFVYSPQDNDRAKQAYNEFVPLDGQFRDNVIIQVKNGPIDFQPREPFSPLFGAMKKTAVMPELQITQEYLGHSFQLVFLAPMWEELLKSDTYQQGAGSTVARATDGSMYKNKYTAFAGVSNIGLDTTWCGNHFAPSNWYAFGRLAWNNTLTSKQIAQEWIMQTFKLSQKWTSEFLLPVSKIMLESREAAVNYMMPLGLHHIFGSNEHYGPGPWYAPERVRKDWTPPYYHQADSLGIGFDRTSTGSNAVSQYHEPLASTFNALQTCPENYLLWFHHVSWNHKMKSGKTLWDELCFKYNTGIQSVIAFRKSWNDLQPYVDTERFVSVQKLLKLHEMDARIWKDGCLLYFQQFSGKPIPEGVEKPIYTLDELKKMNMLRPTLPETIK